MSHVPTTSSARAYLVAVVTTVAIAAVRFALFPLVGDVAPYTPFVVSVMVAASYGGLKAGVLATALGAVIGIYLYVQPHFSLRIEALSEWIAVAFFIVAGITISWICEALHTSRRRLEAKQRELEREIMARERAEHLARESERQLRAADQHKNAFLAMLAHELRNPLAPIRNAAGLLRLRSDPELLRVEEMLDMQVDHLSRLIEDLLDVSRVGRGQLALRTQRLSLRAVVSAALESTRQTIESHGHELTVAYPSEPLELEADSMRLGQVFTNLLRNAAKYTERGGYIRVIVERRAQHAVVRIKDTGMGIPPECLPHVFDLFYQAEHTAAHSERGLGIGLTLVRHLVEMHGGMVEAHSEGRGCGSEFTVLLPIEGERSDCSRAAQDDGHRTAFLQRAG